LRGDARRQGTRIWGCVLVARFGREEALYWVRSSTTCGVEGQTGEDLGLTTMWGQAGSPWVFSAMAGSPEVRDELTAAFVTAAS
jgi:hypothetical protein